MKILYNSAYAFSVALRKYDYVDLTQKIKSLYQIGVSIEAELFFFLIVKNEEQKKERKKGHDTIRLNDDTQKSKTYNNCSSVRKFIEASVVHS